jgi:hypothetical protein
MPGGALGRHGSAGTPPTRRRRSSRARAPTRARSAEPARRPCSVTVKPVTAHCRHFFGCHSARCVRACVARTCSVCKSVRVRATRTRARTHACMRACVRARLCLCCACRACVMPRSHAPERAELRAAVRAPCTRTRTLARRHCRRVRCRHGGAGDPLALPLQHHSRRRHVRPRPPRPAGGYRVGTRSARGCVGSCRVGSGRAGMPSAP